jgi:hypothetical protein
VSAHEYQPAEARKGEQSRETCARCGQIRRITYIEGHRGGVGLAVTFSRDGVTWGAPVRSCRRKVPT